MRGLAGVRGAVPLARGVRLATALFGGEHLSVFDIVWRWGLPSRRRADAVPTNSGCSRSAEAWTRHPARIREEPPFLLNNSAGPVTYTRMANIA